MNKPSKRVGTVVRALALWLICALVVLMPAMSGAGTGSAERDRAVPVLANYSADATTTWHLQTLVADLPDDDAFLALPPEAKIVHIYQRAEAAHNGGGQRFLALLAQRLAQQDSAAAHEPDLRHLVRLAKKMDSKPIELSKNLPRQPVALPAKHRDAVLVMARYTGGGLNHSAQAVLTKFFGMTSQQAFDLLVKSPDMPSVYNSALQNLKSDVARDAAVRDSVVHLTKVFPAAKFEPAFRRYMRRTAKSTTSSKGSTAPAQERFKAFVDQAYPKKKQRFERMSSGRDERGVGQSASSHPGLGGVLLGAEILGPDLAVTSLSARATTTGQLELIAATKYGQLTYGPVAADDLHAAWSLVREPLGNGSVGYSKGIGIPVISLEPAPLVSCNVDSRALFLSDTALDEVLLHPALVDTRIGRAIILTDAHLDTHGAYADLVQHARGLADPNELMRVSRYLWVDRPVQIQRAKGRLLVSPKTGNRAIELRAVRPGGKGLVPGFSAHFDDALDSLKQTPSEVQQLDRFAQLVAVLRWGAESGAQVDLGTPGQKSSARTLRAVTILDGQVSPVPLDLVSEARSASLRSIRTCMKQVEKRAPNVPQIRKQFLAFEKKLESYQGTPWLFRTTEQRDELESAAQRLSKVVTDPKRYEAFWLKLYDVEQHLKSRRLD